jgi:hypothetical protein
MQHAQETNRSKNTNGKKNRKPTDASNGSAYTALVLIVAATFPTDKTEEESDCTNASLRDETDGSITAVAFTGTMDWLTTLIAISDTNSLRPEEFEHCGHRFSTHCSPSSIVILVWYFTVPLLRALKA